MLFFNDLPLPAIHMDRETRILNSNSRAKNLFGWNSVVPEQQFFRNFLSPDETPSFDAFYNQIEDDRPKAFNTQLNIPHLSPFSVTIKASVTEEGNRIFLLNEQDVWEAGCGKACRHASVLEAQYQNNPGGILLVNNKMEILSCNREFINIWEIPPAVLQSKDVINCLDCMVEKVTAPGTFLQNIYNLYANTNEISRNEVFLTDGRVLYRYTYPIFNFGTYIGRVWYYLDITELRQAQVKIEKQQIFQNAILEHVQDGIIACDEEGKITLANRAGRNLYKMGEGPPYPGHFGDAKHFTSLGEVSIPLSKDPLTKVLEGKTLKNYEIELINKENEKHTLRVNGQMMHSSEGSTLGAVISLQDITDVRTAKKKLHHLAYHDVLTDLPNRRLFHDLLEQILKQGQREQVKVGVLFLDIDNFKTVNDRYGHLAGDQLLQAISVNLKECLRDSDILCRWGGDEFIIGLPTSKDTQGMKRVAEKIRLSLLDSILSHKKALGVSVSIGAALSPDHGTEPDLLIRNADMAMYMAKRAGKNRCEIYSPH
jgi:diguanylate cyclase (GGDEF)-like protein